MKLAGTEKTNPRSRGLDRKSTLEILRILNREDASVAAAVRKDLPQIGRAVDAIVRSLERSGKLIYVGAGTSGRIAILDAAECPPTFGTSPHTVQALMAGGGRALRGAAEGAEDSATRGARDLAGAGLAKGDVVVGITASGTTPYVLGAIKFARLRGAVTVGVTSNSHSALARVAKIAIVPQTGPEAIAGSTRLKAGTAQKMVLNLLSTTAMVRLGRVFDNWMVYVALTNQKLRQRGVRILEEAAGVSASTAARALRQTGHDLPVSLVMLKSGRSANDSKRLLADFGGNVRRALESTGPRGARKTGRGK